MHAQQRSPDCLQTIHQDCGVRLPMQLAKLRVRVLHTKTVYQQEYELSSIREVCYRRTKHCALAETVLWSGLL